MTSNFETSLEKIGACVSTNERKEDATSPDFVQ